MHECRFLYTDIFWHYLCDLPHEGGEKKWQIPQQQYSEFVSLTAQSPLQIMWWWRPLQDTLPPAESRISLNCLFYASMSLSVCVYFSTVWSETSGICQSEYCWWHVDEFKSVLSGLKAGLRSEGASIRGRKFDSIFGDVCCANHSNINKQSTLSSPPVTL